MAAKPGRMTADRTEKGVYSLWLMPRGRIANQLRTLIGKLSREYSTPTFEPHVTLIGELELSKARAIAKTKELATHIEPFEIKLSQVAHLDQYFRCVFIKAHNTKVMLNANSIARKIFEQETTQEYMPHLSLVYGNLRNHTRKHIIRDIGDKMDIRFLAKEVYLYYTGGLPGEWYRVSIVPCSRNSAIRYTQQ